MEFTGRTDFGTSKTVTINTPNKIGLVVFDGTAGHRASFTVSQLSVDVSLYSPYGAKLAGPIHLDPGGGFIELISLPNDGTYTILVDPSGTSTGNANVNVFDVPQDTVQTAIPTPEGAEVVVPTTTAPGQNAKVTFSGTAGQWVSVFAKSVTGDPGVTVDVYLTNPDGSGNGGGSGISAGYTWFSDIRILPVSGTYTVWVNPRYERRGGVTLKIYDIPPDTIQTVTPTPQGAVVVVPPTIAAGQRAKVTFVGTTGQRIAFLANSVTGDPGVAVNFYFTNPDGSFNGGGAALYAGQKWFSDVRVLPSNGLTRSGWIPCGNSEAGQS